MEIKKNSSKELSDESSSYYKQYPITIAYLNENFQPEDSDSTNVSKPVRFTISDSESDSNKEAIYSNITRFSAFDDALYNRVKTQINKPTIEVLKNIPEDIELKNKTAKIDNDPKPKSEDEVGMEEGENLIGKYIVDTRTKLNRLMIKHEKLLRKLFWLIFIIVAYPIYFGFAIKIKKPLDFPPNLNNTIFLKEHIFSNNAGLALLILTVIGYSLLIWDNLIINNLEKLMVKVNKSTNLVHKFGEFCKKEKAQMIRKWFGIVIVAICCAVYLLYTTKEYKNLFSLFGLCGFILIAVVLSKNPSKINMRILLSGVLMQIVLGVFVMRTEFGIYFFKFLGKQIDKFLSFTDYGSRLVFGVKHTDHFFAFKAMPVLIFFSSMINLLYHFGIVQYFILKVSWVINIVMGTSPTESITATANIFLGQSETPLLVQPFLEEMTVSEIFAVMVGGFSTVSGSVLAAYIGFGIAADHLLVASIMSAPAALAMAKVLYPETKKTKADWNAIKNFPKNEATNVFEIISTGAVSVLKCTAAIISTVLVFVAIFNFIDAVVAWFLSMLDVQNAGLNSILQFLFYPLAFLMGIPFEDCLSVSKLLGIKTFINEFVAYKELGDVINFRKEIIENGTLELYKNGTNAIPNNIAMIWQEKSIIIATYALCGFSNFGSIGVQIASLSSLCPTRLKTFSEIATMAMIGGTLACFMTACIAGILYQSV